MLCKMNFVLVIGQVLDTTQQYTNDSVDRYYTVDSHSKVQRQHLPEHLFEARREGNSTYIINQH
jgi:hypothetical protein